MLDLTFGYLFKRYCYEGVEIFKFVDYVVGIEYVNQFNMRIVNILTGNYFGEICETLDKQNLLDFIIVREDPEKIIKKEEEDYVNIKNLIERKCSITGDYYYRNTHCPTKLNIVEDKKLIKWIEKSLFNS